MDLGNLGGNIDEGSRMDLKHPASGETLTYEVGEETRNMHLILLGRDSEKYRKIERQITNKRIKERQSFRTAKVTKEQLEEDSIALVSAVTIGGKVFMDGEEMEVTPEVAKRLYQNRKYDWIREQADFWIDNRENYFRD